MHLSCLVRRAAGCSRSCSLCLFRPYLVVLFCCWMSIYLTPGTFDVFCLLIGHGCSASLSLCFISVDVGWQLKYTGWEFKHSDISRFPQWLLGKWVFVFSLCLVDYFMLIIFLLYRSQCGYHCCLILHWLALCFYVVWVTVVPKESSFCVNVWPLKACVCLFCVAFILC